MANLGLSKKFGEEDSWNGSPFITGTDNANASSSGNGGLFQGGYNPLSSGVGGQDAPGVQQASSTGGGGGFGAPAGPGTYGGAIDPNAFNAAKASGMSQDQIYGWALNQGMNAQQAAAAGGNQQDYANYLANNYKAQSGATDQAALAKAMDVGKQWGFNDSQINNAGAFAYSPGSDSPTASAGSAVNNLYTPGNYNPKTASGTGFTGQDSPLNAPTPAARTNSGDGSGSVRSGTAPQSATNPTGVNDTYGYGTVTPSAATSASPSVAQQNQTQYPTGNNGFGGQPPMMQSNEFQNGQPNPYLQAQADNISRNATDNYFNNVAPVMRSAAEGNGQYGGSRQGIAEGLAMKNLNQDITGQLSNLYGGAYENSQNRDLQKYIADQQAAQAQAGLGLQSRSIDNQYALGQGQLSLGNRTADQQYQLGSGQLALGNRTADQNYQLGQGQLGVAQGQLALGNRTADQQYALGNRNADINQQGVNNQYTLGQGQLALGNRTQDQNYALGNRNADINQQGVNNQFKLGTDSNANQRLGIDNTYQLGLLNNSTQRYGIDQNTALGRYTSDNSLRGQMAGADATLGAASTAANASMTNGRLNYDATMAGLAQNNSQFGQTLAQNRDQFGQTLQTNKDQFAATNALGNKNADNNYMLGQGQLALGNKTADNTYNLGLANNRLGNDTLDFNKQTTGDAIGFRNSMAPYQQLSTLMGLGDKLSSEDWSNLQKYAGSLPGAGTGAGSTSTTTKDPGVFGWMSSLFSDARLKEDITRIGTTDGGLPIYTYRYKGEQAMQMGVMAQEAIEFCPDAVVTHPSGYLMVDYAKVK